MSVTDPIADALTKIRNAYRAKHMTVRVNHSSVVESIIRILAEENYLNNYDLIERDPKKNINRKQISINLRYTNTGDSVMRGIERVSRPGRRVYLKAGNVPSVFNNTGCAIISTNRGVFTDRVARNENLGGEYICKVW